MPIYKAITFSDDHSLYIDSRVKDGYSQDTIEALAQYDFIMRNGDTIDLHYAYHLLTNKFLRDNPGKNPFGDIAGEEKLNPILKERLRQACNDGEEINRRLVIGLSAHNPKCNIIDIGGNHDNITRFIRHMQELQAEQPNYRFYSEYVVAGDGLFTHGDTVLQKKNIEQRDVMKPRSYIHEVLEQRLENWLHNFVQTTLFLVWNQRQLVVPRFAERLEEQKNMQVHLDSINHCFFGHVHVTPFDNEFYHDKSYHQAGASIKGRTCRPLEITIEAPEGTPLFTGEHGNIILPGAKITNVRAVEIPGLSFEAENKWADRLRRAANFVGEQLYL